MVLRNDPPSQTGPPARGTASAGHTHARRNSVPPKIKGETGAIVSPRTGAPANAEQASKSHNSSRAALSNTNARHLTEKKESNGNNDHRTGTVSSRNAVRGLEGQMVELSLNKIANIGTPVNVKLTCKLVIEQPSPLKVSRMSSSRQPENTASPGSGGNQVSFDIHTPRFLPCIKVAVGFKNKMTLDALADSGLSNTVVDKRNLDFHLQQVGEDDELRKCARSDKKVLERFHFHYAAPQDGVPHEAPMTLGTQNRVTVNQLFYVLPELSYEMVAGLGPESETFESDGVLCLFESICQQYGLKKIMGINVGPWRRDYGPSAKGTSPDVSDPGSVVFGGTDEDAYDKNSQIIRADRDMAKKTKWAVQGKGCALAYVASPGAKGKDKKESTVELLVKKEGKDISIIVDTGTSGIRLPPEAYSRFLKALRDTGLTLYAEKNSKNYLIKSTDLPKLGELEFNFHGNDGKVLTLPGINLVLPPRVGEQSNVPKNYLLLTVWQSTLKEWDIMLGIPLFHVYYVIHDKERSRMEFVEKKRHIDWELQKLLDDASAASESQKPAEASGSGKKRHGATFEL